MFGNVPSDRFGGAIRKSRPVAAASDASAHSWVQPPKIGARAISARVAEAVQGRLGRDERVGAGLCRLRPGCDAAGSKSNPLPGFRPLENV